MKRFIFLTIAASWLMSAGLAQGGTIAGKVKVMGKENHQNVIVYLDGITGNFPIPAKRPEMNHINLQFQPRALAVIRGSIVDFPNSDPVFHSAFSISPSNPFDLGLYKEGREKFVKFENPGSVEIFCHIHSHMHAYLLVLENPYFAVTDAEGEFVIRDVPDGNHTLRAWHSPSVVLSKQVTVEGRKTVNLDFTLLAGR